MGVLLASFPWRVYCTWTFARPVGQDGALREIKGWLSILRFAFGGEVGWMVGLEQEQGAMWPHGHGLICGKRIVEPTTMYQGKASERVVPLIEPYWRAWMDRHGMGRFKVITGDGAAPSFYCAKYAGKRGAITFSAGLERFRHETPVLQPVTLFPEGANGGGGFDP